MARKDTPPHDSFAKDLLKRVLKRGGQVESQLELLTPPLYVDIYYAPNPTKRSPPPLLELLWRMGDRPTLFEIFSDTPQLDDCLDIVEKGLRWHRVNRPANVGDRVDYLRARAWIISPGHPKLAIKAMEATSAPGWPRGFYLAPALADLMLVDVAQLPLEPQTLILRLLGQGETRRRAAEELYALPSNQVVFAIAEIVNKWWTVMTKSAEPQTHIFEPEMLEIAGKIVEKMKIDAIAIGEKRGKKQGKKQGKKEGKASAELHAAATVLGLRLGRELSAPERQRLGEHLASTDVDEVLRQIMSQPEDGLLGWLR